MRRLPAIVTVTSATLLWSLGITAQGPAPGPSAQTAPPPIVAPPGTQLRVTLDGVSTPATVRPAGDLRVHATHGEPLPSPTLRATVFNVGDVAAMDVRLRVQDPSVCVTGPACTAPGTRVRVQRSGHLPLSPCQVEGVSDGVEVSCAIPLPAGESFTYELALSRAADVAAPVGCPATPVVVRAWDSDLSPEMDRTPSDNVVELSPLPTAAATAIHFYPAEGPVTDDRRIATTFVGVPFRAAVELARPPCSATAVPVSFWRADGTSAFTVLAAPTPDNPRVALTGPVAARSLPMPGVVPMSAMSVFWPSTAQRVSRVEGGDTLLPPRAGDRLRATASGASAELTVAAPPGGSGSVVLEPIAGPSTDGTIPEGERYRIAVRLPAQSPLRELPSLPVLLVHHPPPSAAGAEATVKVRQVGREADGVYRSATWSATEEIGTRIEAQFAYASRDPAHKDALTIVGASRRVYLVTFEGEKEPADSTFPYGSRATVRVSGTSTPLLEGDVEVLRQGTVISSGRVVLAGMPSFRLSASFALSSVRPGDSIRVRVPFMPPSAEYRIGPALGTPVSVTTSRSVGRPAEVRRDDTLEIRARPRHGGVWIYPSDELVGFRLVDRDGRVRIERPVPLESFDSERNAHLGRVHLARSVLGLDVQPGERIQIYVHGAPSDQGVVEIPVGVPGPKVLLESTGGESTRAALPFWAAIRGVLEFEAPPSEPPAVVLRVVRPKSALLARERTDSIEASMPTARDAAGRFVTSAMDLESDPQFNTPQFRPRPGDAIQIRYGDGDWQTYQLTGRAPVARSVHITPIGGSPRAALWHNADAAVEVVLDRPVNTRTISAVVTIKEKPEGSQVLTLSRTRDNHYRGVIERDMRAALGYVAGRSVTAAFGDLEHTVPIVLGPDAGSTGRLVVNARAGRLDRQTPVTVLPVRRIASVSLPHSGAEARGVTPFEVDLPPGTYRVEVGNGPMRFTPTAELRAGETATVELDYDALGRIAVNTTAHSPKMTYIMPRSAESLPDWTSSSGEDGMVTADVPPGVYAVQVMLPDELGGGSEVFENVAVTRGQVTEVLVDASARIRVMVRDAGGQPLSRPLRLTLGERRITGTTGEWRFVRPGTYEVSSIDPEQSMTALAGTIRAEPGQETELELLLGRIIVPRDPATSDERVRIEIDQRPAALGEDVDVAPGTHVVEIGSDSGGQRLSPSEVHRVEVAPGATVVVDRDVTSARLAIKLPDNAVPRWQVLLSSIEGPGHYEYRIVRQGIAWVTTTVDVPPGTVTRDAISEGTELLVRAGAYRLSLRGTAATAAADTVVECVQHLQARARRLVTAGCGELGTLDVSVTGASGQPLPASVRLEWGAAVQTVRTDRAAARVVFRVPPSTYVVRVDGIGELPATVSSGKTTTVAVAAR